LVLNGLVSYKKDLWEVQVARVGCMVFIPMKMGRGRPRKNCW